jgi:hypothetical protein
MKVLYRYISVAIDVAYLRQIIPSTSALEGLFLYIYFQIMHLRDNESE